MELDPCRLFVVSTGTGCRLTDADEQLISPYSTEIEASDFG